MHNFIRLHDPNDFEFETEINPGELEDEEYGELGGSANSAEIKRASQRREEIAAAMWADYQKLKGRRRYEVLNSVF